MNAVRLPIGIAPASTRMRPEPDHGDGGQVEDRRDDRERKGEQAVDAEAGVEQVDVRVVEALLLVPRPDEGPDDAHAGERLAHDLVDPVELDLHRPEQRDRPAHHEADHERHERQDDEEEARQGHVLVGAP